MAINSLDKVHEIVKKSGSAYRATNTIAAKARKLKESCHHVISDSEAVDWAITGVPPENLDNALKVKAQKDVGISKEDRLSLVLDTIEQEDIREAVLKSYKLSVKNHQVSFDYNSIKDRGTRTRIRILTRVAFLP